MFEPTGYSEETRQLVLGMDAAGIRLRVVPFSSADWRATLARPELARLQELCRTPLRKSNDRLISIFHTWPSGFLRIADGEYHVGRAMFETDRIPEEWVAACNRMDEIWVPSAFNIESFARSGVPRGKLVRIPGGIDVDRFCRQVRPLSIPGRRGFNFLAVCGWELRKGWDVLLRAFVEEFGPEEDVALILKAPPPPGRDIRDEVHSLLRRYGLASDLPPNIVFIQPYLHAERLPGLYQAADAFVLPTRGEGWGRPFMEAMLMERPVIATRWSGHLEFLNDENAYLVDCKVVDVPKPAWHEAPAFRGHRWAEPSRAHLRRLMRLVFEDREGARRKAGAGRESIIANFRRETVAERVKHELERIAQTLPRAGRRTRSARISGMPRISAPDVPVVVWEGSQFVYHSLARVNRELSLQLIQAGCEVCVRPYERNSFGPEADERFHEIVARIYAVPSRAPDVHVTHRWPPNLIPPPDGRWVVIQPWEFGSLPKRWLRAFSTEVDEIWVPSHPVRQGYVESGIAPERVIVIPNGVNAREFHPVGERRALGRAGAYRFLFVGGTIWRKGIDLLLEAYLKAFRKSDDVCLVIKDMGGKSFYRGQTHQNEIVALQRRRNAPPILYLDSELREGDMPGLYRACDTLVHPYRGEGFGLPILEAMACGVPAIVTNGGACLDFCNQANSLLVAASKTYLPKRVLDDFETVKSPWMYEVDVGDLIEKMRYAYEHPAEMKALGRKASEEVRTRWTWRHSAAKALERIEALRRRPVRRRRIFPLAVEPQHRRKNNRPVRSV